MPSAPDTRRATVVGESFGGALALSFALARPEQVNGLVVLNSFPHFTPQIRLHLARLALRALPWGAMSLVRRLTASRLHSRHTHREEIRRFMELTALATREGYCNRLQVLTRYDVRQRLRDVRAPALFLASQQDHLVPSVAQARVHGRPRSSIHGPGPGRPWAHLPDRARHRSRSDSRCLATITSSVTLAQQISSAGSTS